MQAAAGRHSFKASRPQQVLPAARSQAFRVSRASTLVARAENRSGDSSFLAGFVMGGVVFGALGFLLAPQISKALLNDDSRLRLPRFLEDDTPKDPEATKQDLIDKIAQLNASIDEVAAQLKSKDVPEVEAEAATLS